MRLHIKGLLRIGVSIVGLMFGAGLYLTQIHTATTSHNQIIVSDTAKQRNIQNSVKENTTENDVTKFQALSNYAVWQTVHKTFVKMKYGPVYLFGVVAGNSTTNASWDLVKIYGGIDKSHYYKSNLRCCLAYKDAEYASFVKVNPDYVRRFQVPSAIWSIHVTCPNVRHAQNAVPVGVALTVDNYNCSKSDVRYVIPYFPLREAQQKVAIATKIAYGNISAEMIIEWMEWYRFIEVDKVVTFYIKSLNDKALKVLQYYASTGILDLYFYEPAALDKYPRDTYNDHHQRQNDQQIVVDDSFERMGGYRYFGILDFDEFLMPLEGKTIKEMMSSLNRSYPNAAGIVFLVQYFFMSWEKTDSSDCDMILCSYTQRNSTRREYSKNICMPDRVAMGGVDTHVIKPRDGYMKHKGFPHFGMVHHFRLCRQRKLRACMTKYGRTIDTTVATWAQKIKQNVEAVREKIFGSTTVP